MTLSIFPAHSSFPSLSFPSKPPPLEAEWSYSTFNITIQLKCHVGSFSQKPHRQEWDVSCMTTISGFPDLPPKLSSLSVCMTFLSCGILNICVRPSSKQDCWCMMINSATICSDPPPPRAGKGRLATVVRGNTSMFSLIQCNRTALVFRWRFKFIYQRLRSPTQVHTSYNPPCTCIRLHHCY